ncbi:MAG: Peptidase family S58 [Chloroflexi bacterium ADurb.Bin325]|nr:MAG: Peptidase family S58 [Chloroflexi bacterium ADurb.Bin325]
MSKPRARDLGIPFDGTPGAYNAITDVAGVTVGHTTLISPPPAAVRTGVTAILPRGHNSAPVFGAWHTLNGCGEMTGTTWLTESGLLAGPVMLTNTMSVGVVADAVADWWYGETRPAFVLPVVAETYDGFLNDIRGRHVREQHALSALAAAASGPVAEGNVGGGTGMICHGFKGGIGTASRVLADKDGGYTLGVLVQANHGARERLTIAGAPVGAEIADLRPEIPRAADAPSSSIIAVVAVDCPLLPHQLRRLAQRVSLGIGRVGGLGENGSGDIFIAFSTAALGPESAAGVHQVGMLANSRMDALFAATVQATEEAIVNALVAAEDMVGRQGHKAYALPVDRLQAVLRKHSRLLEGTAR